MVACSKYPDLEVILVGNGSLIEKAIEARALCFKKNSCSAY